MSQFVFDMNMQFVTTPTTTGNARTFAPAPSNDTGPEFVVINSSDDEVNEMDINNDVELDELSATEDNEDIEDNNYYWSRTIDERTLSNRNFYVFTRTEADCTQ